MVFSANYMENRASLQTILHMQNTRFFITGVLIIAQFGIFIITALLPFETDRNFYCHFVDIEIRFIAPHRTKRVSRQHSLMLVSHRKARFSASGKEQPRRKCACQNFVFYKQSPFLFFFQIPFCIAIPPPFLTFNFCSPLSL